MTRGFILFKWFNFKDFLPVHSQFPIGHQFVAVDLDPRLDKLHSTLLDATFNDLSVRYTDNCLFALVFDMDVRQVVLPCVEKIQGYDDSVEHGNDGHGVSIAGVAFFSILFAHRTDE